MTLTFVGAEPRTATLWSRLSGASIKWRVLGTVALVNLLVSLAFAIVLIYSFRISTQHEIEAAMASAEHFVEGIALSANAERKSEDTIANDLAGTPNYRRHLRLTLDNADGRSTQIPSPTIEDDANLSSEGAPAWFQRLIAGEPIIRTIQLAPNSSFTGQVILTSEAGGNADEAWRNFKTLMIVVLSGSAAVLAALYFILKRVLKPLTAFTACLRTLQRADYGVRVPKSSVKEIRDLSAGFNSLAETLERTRAENAALNRNLVFAHDNERRRIAVELHDEFGPCLFGIKADVDSLETMTDDLSPDLAKKFRGRVRDIIGVIDRLQSVNRGMLKNLRPMALGHVALESLLRDLVAGFDRTNAATSYSLSVTRLAPAYDETLDLTLYRCIQESLTNVTRHAQAKHVGVEVCEIETPRSVEARIIDDGCGIASSAVPGYGISGMRERVQALGGHFALISRQGRGTTVQISLPLTQAVAPPSFFLHIGRTE